MAEIREDTDTTIDVEGLASSIEVTMSQYELFMPRDRCIFKTPTALRRHNEKAYIPDAFSIGPLHHGSPNCPNCPNFDAFSIGPLRHGSPNCPNCPNFKATETIKAEYLRGFISRSKSSGVLLKDYINCIGKELERNARECYAVPIRYSPEEFVKILVIDGCFIIELFLRYASSEDLRKKNDPIFGMSSMVEVLYHDLILLENQVPWMILEHLFSKSKIKIKRERKSKKKSKTQIELAIQFFSDICPFRKSKIKIKRKRKSKTLTLIELAIEFFSDIFPFTGTDDSSDNDSSDNDSSDNDSSDNHSSDDHNLVEIKHIPDLFKKWMASSMEVHEEDLENSQSKSGWGYQDSYTLIGESEKESSSSSDQGDKKMIPGYELIPSATRLVEAGIKFRPSSGTGSKKILFRNGFLEIPPIKINEATETLFRNLISFEQCYPSDDSITSYAKLLDNLINTPRDAEILSESKILFNWLNPEDAAQLFDKLYHDTYIWAYSYEKLAENVNKYCEKRWPRWRAVFVGKYFNTPWAGLSTSAAVILLFLTSVQTWYTIRS